MSTSKSAGLGPASLFMEPLSFFRKKDGTLRICIDYRALNQQTSPEKYALPRIDDLLDQLVNAHYLSSIELYTSYH